jgi:hypothetical protein
MQFPPHWLALLAHVPVSLRYRRSRLANPRILQREDGHECTASRINIAAALQAADEMRRVRRLAYRMRQSQITHPEFRHKARQTWQGDPIWQTLREIIDTLLVTWDSGEGLVALQYVLKPTFDELFMTQFRRLARAAGDDVLDRILFSLNEKFAWHCASSRSLILTAIRDTSESAPMIEDWIEARCRASAAQSRLSARFLMRCCQTSRASRQRSARSSNSENTTANLSTRRIRSTDLSAGVIVGEVSVENRDFS